MKSTRASEHQSADTVLRGIATTIVILHVVLLVVQYVISHRHTRCNEFGNTSLHHLVHPKELVSLPDLKRKIHGDYAPRWGGTAQYNPTRHPVRGLDYPRA